MLLKAAAALAALLAVFVYRSGRIAWNHVLTIPDLPPAYYVGGDWSSACSLVKDPSSDDVNFCEDITFWDHLDAQGALADRLVLMGCDPNRKAWNTVMGPLRDPNPRGHLFLYVPSTDAVHRVTLQGYPADHDFHPLGMDVYPSHDGAPSSLFVVNHARAQTTIEQLVLDPARPTEARYVRTLRSPHFVSPNALALTSPTSFYVSNDHMWTRRLPGPIGRVAPLVETLAGLPLGWVAHVSVHAHADPSDGGSKAEEEEEGGGGDDDDGGGGGAYTLTHATVAPGVPFANGIALSPDGAHLAVASTTLGRVYMYDVSNANATANATVTPSLSLSHSVPVPFMPDNIVYDDEGALLVTGHPHFPMLAAVAANKTDARAPSWVVSVTHPGSKNHSEIAVETIFQSDGSVFGSSSTTLRDARAGGTIYIAGLYERGILVCRP